MAKPNEKPRTHTGALYCVEPAIEAVDRPMGLAAAATALGVPYHVVQRAARRGLVPTYRLGTSRPYVKLRDFLDLMRRDTNG
jgi:hypothetical protein